VKEKTLRVAFAAAMAAADPTTRQITGTIVPFGEIGQASVDGEPVQIRYLPGSITFARDRTPLVLSHDNDRPIGVLAAHAETTTEATATFKVDPTPDGDAALVQAASGSRGGLSVYAELLDYVETPDGVLEVAKSAVYHVGLVTIPAFQSAEVTEVAAAHQPQEGSMDPKNLRERLGLPEDATDEQVEQKLAELTKEPEAEPKQEPAPAPKQEPIPEAEQEIAVVHGRPVMLARKAEPQAKRPGELGALVQAMLLAQNGDREAAKIVQAALSVIDSTDVPGLMPKSYVGAVLGSVTIERALADRVAIRRPLPSVGMAFTKPKWTTLPDGGWVAENDPTPSNAPEIGTGDVAILEWAYGVAMSYAVATRSSPDAIESIFRAAVQDYYADVEQKIADTIAANDSPTGAGATLGEGIAAYYAAVGKKAPKPNVLLVATDVYGDLFDALVMVPVTQGTTGVDANLGGTIGGLEVVVSPFLVAGTEIVTTRGAIELRETDPVRLTANVIGALQVELGVTAFASFDVEIPGGFITLTPPAGAAGTSTAKRTAGKTKGSGK
jgi:HK97 family phage major capsid protein